MSVVQCFTLLKFLCLGENCQYRNGCSRPCKLELPRRFRFRRTFGPVTANLKNKDVTQVRYNDAESSPWNNATIEQSHTNNRTCLCIKKHGKGYWFLLSTLMCQVSSNISIAWMQREHNISLVLPVLFNVKTQTCACKNSVQTKTKNPKLWIKLTRGRLLDG